MAALEPTLTINELLVGMFGLAPTVQVMVVELAAVAPVHGIPSITTEGVPAFRFVPVIVRVYPPKMSPYFGEKEVTMAVFAAV